jgi:molybdenum cofactor biosynthesis enzyme MoaA
MKYKSCKHLESSLYIAPDEIRACCQRFFFNGKMRGDAELLKIKDDKNLPGYNEITKARAQLFNDIQNNKSDQCMGCPQLSLTNKKPDFNGYINHLSIEHHSVCNLRCTYCSETYYGGKKSKYNVSEFVKKLSREKSLKNCKQVVWGGGEPTLDKTFENIVNEIEISANPKIYHRVFTNSVRYHESISKFLKNGLIKIVTSIDAGTPETFMRIRGRNKFYDVFQNLEKYSSINAKKITVKYILTEENIAFLELEKFVENCIKYKLIDCCFQISMNFKNDKLSIAFLKAIIYLMSIFKKNKILKFFGDDHIMARFKKLNEEEKFIIMNYINQNKFEDLVLNNFLKTHKVSLFGINLIAENVLKKNITKSELSKITLVDSDENKQGKFISGIQIVKPEILKINNDKIFIASAQSYDDIYEQLVSNLGVSNSRIIQGIFI